MSFVRMHFCTLVARGYGAGTTPVRYGTNGTMPATVKSSDGSSETSEADGTTVWPRAAKKSSQRWRISAVCMVPFWFLGMVERPAPGAGCVARRD
jgi:hypothetical protein